MFSISGSISADLIMLKICGEITKRLIGFSGDSSLRGFSVTNPWKMYERFFQYFLPISSKDASLNQGRTSVSTGHESPYISPQGTCTVTGLFSPPFTPGKVKRII